MELVKPPEPLLLAGNISTNWVQLKAMTRTARTQPRGTTFRHSAQPVLLLRSQRGQSARPTTAGLEERAAPPVRLWSNTTHSSAGS
ncbi:hypothetical protein MTO96_015752 [Rhipicephalus appendiculatus]